MQVDSAQNYAGNNTNTQIHPSQSSQVGGAQGASGPQGASGAMGADGLPMGMMTCDELLAWLQAKLMGMSDRVRDKMNIGNANADAQNMLNNVSRELNNCRNNHGDPETAAAAIRTALDAHSADGTIPPDLKGKLETMLCALDGLAAKNASAAAAAAKPKRGTDHPFHPSSPPPPNASIPGEHYDDIVGSITNQNAALEKIGNMGLTDLNMLVSQMSQATGLVSSMMSSFNDSAKGIISNMRG